MPAQMKRSPTPADPVNEASAHPSTMSTKRAFHRTHVKLYLSCRIETVRLLMQN